MEPTIYFVIPCYNEEAVLPETTRRLAEKLQAMQSAGSSGKTAVSSMWTTAARTRPGSSSPSLTGRTLRGGGEGWPTTGATRNALLCGLMTAKDRCDCAISLDADLQDDTDAWTSSSRSTWRAAMWCTACATSGTRTPGSSAPPPRLLQGDETVGGGHRL